MWIIFKNQFMISARVFDVFFAHEWNVISYFMHIMLERRRISEAEI